MSIHYKIIAVTMIALILVSGCARPMATPDTTPVSPTNTPAPADTLEPATTPLNESENINRTILTYDELMNSFDYDSPVDDGAFAMPDDALPPDHIFEGRLELFGEDTGGGFETVRGTADLEPEVLYVPEFDYEFVQSDGYLIPVQRGLIIADNPNWNYIIGPGRVWKEDGDQGYSRASFPFALTWKGGNATFNGVMTFLFDDKSVSNVWYQITQ